MDRSTNYNMQEPAMSLILTPASSAATDAVSTITQQQSSVIAQEYLKVCRGVADFVVTIRNMLLEKGHELDSDHLLKLLSKFQSLPQNSESEVAQNSQQLTIFILTAFTMLADIVKSLIVINSGSSGSSQVSSSGGCDQGSLKTEQPEEQSTTTSDLTSHQLTSVSSAAQSSITDSWASSFEEDEKVSVHVVSPRGIRTRNEGESFQHNLASADFEEEYADLEAVDDQNSDSDHEPCQVGFRGRGRPRKSLACDYCPRKFNARKRVWAHMDKCHREMTRSQPPQQHLRKKTAPTCQQVHLEEPISEQHVSEKSSLQTTTLSVKSGTARRGRPRKSLMCEYCPRMFSDRRRVLDHMDYHHREEYRSRSQQCQQEEADARNFPQEELNSARDNSLQQHTAATQHQQGSCAQEHAHSCAEEKPPVLQHDILQVSEEGSNLAAKQEFDLDSNFRSHTSDLESEDRFNLNTGEGPQAKPQTRARRRGTKHKSVTCDFCPKKFQDRDQVWAHMDSHHQENLQLKQQTEKPKKNKGPPRMSRWCDFCPKVFTTRYNVVVHMRNIHSKEMNWTPKSYLCPECGHSSQTPSMLKYHMKRHTGIRDHKCPQCPLSFFTLGELKGHTESVHLGLRPFLCPLCGAAFKKQYALNCHMRAHGSEREHACSVCGKAFKERHQLNRHMSLHSPEKPYQCQFCDAKYSHKSGLHIHLKRSKACPGSEAVKQSKAAE